MENKKEYKIYTIDVAGKSLGRIATKIATLLRGKGEIDYTPHLDPKIKVKIINLNQVIMTGKKSVQKIYRHYTGYPCGLKKIKHREMIKKYHNRVLKLAVLRMLNKNSLRAKLMKRIIIG